MRHFVDGIDAKRLWRRYLLGLGIIISLLVGSHAASTWAIRSTDNDAKVINESGRQRMLSQRILYFASKATDGDVASARGPMTAAIDLFANSHDRLTASPELSDASRRLYFDASSAPALDRLVRSYVRDARLIASEARSQSQARDALRRMEQIGPGVLLKKLDRAVKLYETEARERSARISMLQTYSLWLAALTILIEALLIFWPAQVAARRALARLEDQAQVLEAARQSEKDKNVELEELRSAAEHEARHDPLTGLANRRYLEREMTALAEEAEETGRGVAVLHIDLDNFKQINDSLGHAAGDYVLEHVADSLKEIVGPTDFVARVGGDEFVVLTRSSGDRRPLEDLGGRIIDRLCKPVSFDGDWCRFGASVGIDIGIAAETGPEIDPELLLTNADIALYRAKNSGRGRFAFFCEEMRDEVNIAKALTDDLLTALTERQFFALYQPQICARTGALRGVEALARWRHPERGDIPPDMFLPVADRLGVTAQIDHQILEIALADLAAWDAQGLGAPRVSVNVSGARLRDRALGRKLLALAPPPGRIAFEIPDDVASRLSGDQHQMTIDAIRESGVQIELGGFGSENSSLASILFTAADRVKISRNLTASLLESDAHRKMADSIIQLCAGLDVEAVAEGVESEPQAQLLRALGCPSLQGYHMAMPMTSAALARWLSAHAAASPGAQAADAAV